LVAFVFVLQQGPGAGRPEANDPVPNEVPPLETSSATGEDGTQFVEQSPILTPSVEPILDVNLADLSAKEMHREPKSFESVLGAVLPGVVTVEGMDRYGSGFFIRPGLVVTSYHVVYGQYNIEVRHRNGFSVRARLLEKAESHDLAILELMDDEATGEVVPVGTVNDLHPGREVVAIGSALGLRNTVTRGIVSSVRSVDDVTLVQTDAAINPGNSGGPLVDIDGRVIGVNTIKLFWGESIALAVAIDHVIDLIEGDEPLSPLAIGAVTEEKDRLMMNTGELARADFNAKVERLAKRSNHVDSLWDRYQSRCGRCPAAKEERGREWFVIWERWSRIPHPDSRECQDLMSEIGDRAESIGEEMWSAEQQARRDNVGEDVRRFVRRYYKMEWTGWES
jgi:S1-C subfamily serine protease